MIKELLFFVDDCRSWRITYIYSALGEKLAKKMKDNTYQYYCGSMVYKNDKSLNYLLFEEGLVDKSSGGYTYEYHLKDHLGNTRVTFQPNGSATTTTQVAEYYPFGSSYLPISPAGTNKYLYNGKEKQDDVLSGTALDWYDYGARFYDPTIGRWHSVDPLVEKHQNYTPYAYVYNNPILLIDPDGRDSTQRAQALEKANEYVAKNKDGKGNSYKMGAKGDPGEPVDCSGLASKVVKAGGESDPNEGKKNGVTNIANNTQIVDEEDVMSGNLVILDGSTHTGIIILVERDKDGKIVNEQMIDSGGNPSKGKSGPRTSNIVKNGEKQYWGNRVDGYRKWDTKPDETNSGKGNSISTNNSLWESIKSAVSSLF